MVAVPHVSSLHVFPVKSLRGVDVPAAHVERWGVRGDRRWMVVEPAGGVLTAREHPRMLGVRAEPLDGGVRLSAPGASDLQVREPEGVEPDVTVGLSRLECATGAGSAADDWLSDALGRRVRLVWLDDPRRRTVSPQHGGRAGDALSLADAGPLLVTTEASMAALNAWVADRALEAADPTGSPTVPAPLPMERFRPNLVVGGDLEPFEEDRWAGLRVGDVELRFAERCDRCSLTTIDLDTLVTTKEPIRTLARHRREDGKTWFGVRMVPVTTGRVAVGDPVTALR
ncbi:MOSC domain-containing protein [Cellulomonas fimi]|uniref:MOSC domain-containing protein n=1 Tax=Cellulomonas fimi TaxID=1708 RepID=UPI00234C124C|nr:MOSC N-terminal beta barrel domain-containing protein [Cellulomonas fimi]MDC7122346.1 MOSC domain-containing protein [Cellulomonas fimi]